MANSLSSSQGGVPSLMAWGATAILSGGLVKQLAQHRYFNLVLGAGAVLLDMRSASGACVSSIVFLSPPILDLSYLQREETKMIQARGIMLPPLWFCSQPVAKSILGKPIRSLSTSLSLSLSFSL